jgi:acetyl esterase/lipase
VDVQRIAIKIVGSLPKPILRMMIGPPIVGRGVELDPLMQFLWIAGKKQPGVDSMSPADARAGLEAAAQSLQPAVPRSVDVREDKIPGSVAEIPVRIYTPNVGDELPIILFFHFGGFVVGSRNICDGFCGMLCERARAVVINVEYRLAPEHPFPAPIEDGLAVYQWVVNHARELNGDVSRIAVAGDSAGGLLSAVIAQEAKRQSWQMPRCQVLIYPWLVPYSALPSYEEFADSYPLTSSIMTWFGGHYFRSEDQKHHCWSAPLDEPDLRGLPDAIIVTAGFDPLRDEGELFAKRLRDAGVRVTFRCYERLTHSFTMLGGVLPAAREAMTEIADDCARALAKG